MDAPGAVVMDDDLFVLPVIRFDGNTGVAEEEDESSSIDVFILDLPLVLTA